VPRTDFGQAQLYIDTAYIRSNLERLGINPWFGPTELTRPLGNIRIDGGTLAVRRTIFYDAIDPTAEDAEDRVKYVNQLSRLDDTLIRLGTVTGSRPKRQKGVDMRMGRDMIIAAQSNFIEYFVIASGDADFIPAVQQIQDLGPKVLILAFAETTSDDLRMEADRLIELPTNSNRNWGLG